MHSNNRFQKLGLAGSFAIYIPAALLMFGLTKYLIPYLSEITGQETILFWFIVGGLGIFLPLILTGLIILKFEGFTISKETWNGRLRFRKITGQDLLWCFAGLVAVGVVKFIVCNMKFTFNFFQGIKTAFESDLSAEICFLS